MKFKMRIFAVIIALLFIPQPASSRISISDVISVIQFVQNWVNKGSNNQPKPEVRRDSIVIYYKWVGNYDYLTTSDGSNITGCSPYADRNVERDIWMLFVVLVQNRSRTPIYIEQRGFELEVSKNYQIVYAATPMQNSGLPCLKPPWNKYNRPNTPRWLVYKKTYKEIRNSLAL